MKRTNTVIAVVTLVTVMFLAASLHSVEIKKSTPEVSTGYTDELMVSVRVAGGNGSVLEPGERVKLTFQTNRDAYVVLYNIDSDGFVNLLYPRDGKPRRVEGNKINFLPEAGSGLQWVIEGSTGVEYIHAVAVTDRAAIKEQELYYLVQNRDQAEEKRFRIEGDPFLSFNMIDEEIIGDAREHPPASDYTYFYINREVDYPRYLCSKCHAPGKLTDPYNMDCPEIVVERYTHDDDVAYPYPPLFDITYTSDGGDEDYYASSKYVERHLEDEYEEYDDTPIYLSIYYSNYSYPYQYYWPSYRTFWTSYYYNPYLWDYYWYWDFGFSYYFTDYYYHYWPFYSWYYPYSHYWAWDYYNYDYCCYRDYRPLYSDRTLVKRTINYTSTSTDLYRDKAISNSPLSQRGSGNYARRAGDLRTADKSYLRSTGGRATGSRLADRATRKTITKWADYRNRIVTPKQRNPEKRVVHGADRTRDDATRSRDRKTPTSRVPTRSNVRKEKTRSGSSGDRSAKTPSYRSNDRKVDRSAKKSSGSVDRSKKSTGNERKSSGKKSSSKETKKPDKRRETSSRSPSRTTSTRSVSRSSRSTPSRSSSSGGSRSSGSSRSSGGSGKSRRK